MGVLLGSKTRFFCLRSEIQPTAQTLRSSSTGNRQDPGLKLDCVWGGFDQATEEVFSTFLEEYSKNKDSDKSNIVLRSSGVLVTEKEAIEGCLPAQRRNRVRR